jgi:acetoin utilization protein AcuB
MIRHELVQDWMSEDVVTIGPETSLPEAHQIMTSRQIRRLPVVDGNGRLIGLITRGDVRGAQPSQATTLSVWELNYLLATLPVRKVMTPDPITITADATIGEAARTMLENKVSGLPVVNERHQVIGIITESDIFSMVVLNEWQLDQAEAEA